MPAFMTQTGNAMREHEVLAKALLREDIHGTVVQFRDALRDAEVLFEGLQRHWMVRGYIEDKKPVPSNPTVPGNPSPVGTR